MELIYGKHYKPCENNRQGVQLVADHVPYVAEDDCIACGACEEICPEVFTVNETLGFAQVMNPSGAPAAKIQEAVDACPVNCIHWADEPE